MKSGQITATILSAVIFVSCFIGFGIKIDYPVGITDFNPTKGLIIGALAGGWSDPLKL
jgi:hypothetical protein